MIGVELLYELKRIFRNNVFKLFTIFSIVGIITIQYTWINFTLLHVPFVKWYSFWLPWSYKGLPFTIPYMNAFLFNIVQVLFIIFICSDDLSQKHKRTLEAIYCRPISNIEISLGRNLGKIISISLLNLITLGIAFVTNILYSSYALNGLLYIFYWITLTLPTSVFTLGLSILLSRRIKHQAIFISLVLSIIGVTTLLLANWQHGLLDPLARTIPNVFSDIIGHINLGNYLSQRLMILLLGLSLLFISVIFYSRPENSKNTWKKISLVGYLLLVLSIIPAWAYISRFNANRELQEYYKSLQNNYPQNIVDHIVIQRISLHEEKKGFKATSQLQITRLVSSSESLILYLNPELHVDSLNCNNTPVKYTRNGQIIITNMHLSIGDTVNLHMNYHGCIDDNICYLNTPKKQQEQNNKNCIGVYSLGTKSSFDLEIYKLYPPESLWYPTCIIPSRSSLQAKDFTRYTLNVYHKEGRTVISQGIPQKFGDNKTIFNHSHDLPAISLCIGNYNQKTITVDSTRYNLYYFPEHEYLLKGFSNTTESLIKGRIRETKQYLEYTEGTPSKALILRGERDTKYDRVQKYPYQWLHLVESPVAFYVHPSDQNEGERHYYGVVFFPESLITSKNFNFQEQRNEMDEITQLSLIFGTSRSCLLASGSCSINPSMRGCICFIFSKNYPFIHEAISLVCKEMSSLLDRQLTDNRKIKAINYLSRHSLQEAIESNLPPSFLKDIIYLKTAELKSLIASHINFNKFETFYYDFLFRHFHECVQLKTFIKEAQTSIHLQLEPILDKWYKSNHLASFVIKDYCLFYSNSSRRYLYSFKVFNQGEADGIIISNDYQTWLIPVGKAVEIKSWKNDKSNALSLNYLSMPLTQNLPDLLYLKTDTSPNTHSDTIAGIQNLDPSIFEQDSTEIIVDNEDSGFRIKEKETWLTFSRTKNKEHTYGYNQCADGWSLLIDQKYYGNPIQSALVIGIGKGYHEVEWCTLLPEDGEYEVFYYYSPYTEYSKEVLADERNFIINNGTNKHELRIELDPDVKGWISLGIYQFKKNQTAKVSLSDNGNINRYIRLPLKKSRPRIIADAIKWKKITI